MSTLIIGKCCRGGLVLAADRRELRGYEPTEQPKIRQVEIEIDTGKTSILLAGAGVAAFWDEVGWSLSRSVRTEGNPPVKTLLDVVDRVSNISINMSARYQHGSLDERLGCVIGGLEELTSGKAQLYYFAGAGFSRTEFICLGSGETYALPMADILLNVQATTLKYVAGTIPSIFALVERVNVSVSGGPDVFILRDGGHAKQVSASDIEKLKKGAAILLGALPNLLRQRCIEPSAFED